MYITIQLDTQQVRSYDDLDSATKYSIQINKSKHEHPSFWIYKLEGHRKEATFIGILKRRFGSDELEWRM